MGYYSDVRVSTTRDGFEFLKENVTSDLFGGYGYVEERNDEKGVVFGWDGVKWYSWFDEIAEFNNLLFVMADEEIPYEYLVLGEDGATEFETSDRLCSFEHSDLKVHVGVTHSIEVWE